MASVNQTRPHCVNRMGKTHSKLLAARHGRGRAWARRAMCESAFNLLEPSGPVQTCYGIDLPYLYYKTGPTEITVRFPECGLGSVASEYCPEAGVF